MPQKEAYYFSHDSNATRDPKILKLRAAHGWSGYGIYWAIIEALREQPDYKWEAADKQMLSFVFSSGEQEVIDVIDSCLSIGLLEVDDDFIHSPSLTRRMAMKDEIIEKRRAAGRKGGSVGKKASDKQMLSNAKAKGKQGNEMKLKETKTNNTAQNSSETNRLFEEFWNKYDKKVDRRACEKKFKSIINSKDPDVKATAEEIINGAVNYKIHMDKEQTETKFRKNPLTFLNQQSFREYQQRTGPGSTDSAPAVMSNEEIEELYMRDG